MKLYRVWFDNGGNLIVSAISEAEAYRSAEEAAAKRGWNLRGVRIEVLSRKVQS